MFLFCLYGYFVCTELGMLSAQRNQKGGIGFPVELEFQTITTMRVLGIEPCSSARATSVDGLWAFILPALEKENI